MIGFETHDIVCVQHIPIQMYMYMYYIQQVHMYACILYVYCSCIPAVIVSDCPRSSFKTVGMCPFKLESILHPDRVLRRVLMVMTCYVQSCVYAWCVGVGEMSQMCDCRYMCMCYIKGRRKRRREREGKGGRERGREREREGGKERRSRREGRRERVEVGGREGGREKGWEGGREGGRGGEGWEGGRES